FDLLEIAYLVVPRNGRSALFRMDAAAAGHGGTGGDDRGDRLAHAYLLHVYYRCNTPARNSPQAQNPTKLAALTLAPGVSAPRFRAISAIAHGAPSSWP